VLAEGTPDEIRRDAVVQRVYLGARLSVAGARA
jgi:ABC-type branched-subunit amino acid transport system ATPase component